MVICIVFTSYNINSILYSMMPEDSEPYCYSREYVQYICFSHCCSLGQNKPFFFITAGHLNDNGMWLIYTKYFSCVILYWLVRIVVGPWGDNRGETVLAFVEY